MKKGIKLAVTILLFSITLSACSDLLDTKPTDFIDTEAYYKTPEQLQTALNAVYTQLRSVDTYGNNYLYMFNSNTDESYTRLTDPQPTYQYSAGDDKIDALWRGLYTGITRANLLLSKVDGVSAPQNKKDVIKGEALFLRGYYHFLLVSNYGDVPLILEPLGSVSDVHVPRTPAKTVYEAIIKDMTEAEALLETQTATSLGYGGKVTRTAVQGMLARVCLYAAGYPVMDPSKYEDALHWSKKVIDSKEHALAPDYKQIFINYAQDKYDVKESMLEIEFLGVTNGGNLGCTYTGRFSGIQCSDNEKGFSSGHLRATRKLFDSYEIDPASTTLPNKESLDLRRDWNCADYTWGSGSSAVRTAVTNTWNMNAGKWRREYEALLPKDKNYTSQNFALLRYADVLLMFAEAENAVHGATPDAYDAINQVRRRAYGMLLPVPPNPGVNADLTPDLDPDQFLQAIKEERARELCFEALRRNDLIRWGNFVGDMKAFLDYANSNGGSATVITIAATSISDRNVYLPIPIRELTLNKELKQNPGY